MGIFVNGGVQVGRIGSVPVRLHWTAPIGAFVFNGFSFDPVGWACFFGLVLIHELGHAFVVKKLGASVLSVEVSGFGGLCAWRGEVSRVGRAAIAWGGVWAQLLVLVFALLHQNFGPPAESDAGLRVMWALTSSNAWMAAFNLMPIRPLDGSEAWPLPRLLGEALRRRFSRESAPQVHASAHSADTQFEAGERSEEVRSLVSRLLDDARREDAS